MSYQGGMGGGQDESIGGLLAMGGGNNADTKSQMSGMSQQSN